jgi:hypothetical protein
MNKYSTLFDATTYNAFEIVNNIVFFAWRFVPIKINLIHIYNLASTCRGMNVIQSDYVWNEYIAYFIPDNINYMAF